MITATCHCCSFYRECARVQLPLLLRDSAHGETLICRKCALAIVATFRVEDPERPAPKMRRARRARKETIETELREGSQAT